MRPPPELRVPRRRRRPGLALAVSLAVHVVLLLVVSIDGRLPQLPRAPQRLVVLAPPDTASLVYRLPARERPPTGEPGRRPAGQRQRRPERPTSAAPAPIVALPDPVPPPTPVDTAGRDRPEPSEPRTIGRIGPGLGEGRLWVRPLPLPPQELARRLTKSHAELADSAVTAIVQAYLDSIGAEPTSREAPLPSWTTEVAGKKFGLDSKHIYIAGLKIPAAVLALLPIQGGNIDQQKAHEHLMQIRADLRYAAQRADNLEEFKDRIREIRLRKEREREFERNRRTPPPGADTALAQASDSAAERPGR